MIASFFLLRLGHFLWNWYWNGCQRFHVNIGSGNVFVPLGNKPLYLSQCWHKFISTHRVIRLQRVNITSTVHRTAAEWPIDGVFLLLLLWITLDDNTYRIVCIWRLYGHGNGQHWVNGQITGVHIYPWPVCGSQTVHTRYTIVSLIRLDIWSPRWAI